jgi:hypothetical protein
VLAGRRKCNVSINIKSSWKFQILSTMSDNFVRRDLKRRFKGYKNHSISALKRKRAERSKRFDPSSSMNIGGSNSGAVDLDLNDPISKSVDFVMKNFKKTKSNAIKSSLLNQAATELNIRGLKNQSTNQKKVSLEDVLRDSRHLTKELQVICEEEAPVCDGHQMKAILRTVSKSGGNRGRRFYCCCFPSDQQCNFFQWLENNVLLLKHCPSLLEVLNIDDTDVVDLRAHLYHLRLQKMNKDELVQQIRVFNRKIAKLSKEEKRKVLKVSGTNKDLMQRLTEEATYWIRHSLPRSFPPTKDTHHTTSSMICNSVKKMAETVSEDVQEEEEEVSEQEENIIFLSDSSDDDDDDDDNNDNGSPRRCREYFDCLAT